MTRPTLVPWDNNVHAVYSITVMRVANPTQPDKQPRMSTGGAKKNTSAKERRQSMPTMSSEMPQKTTPQEEELEDIFAGCCSMDSFFLENCHLNPSFHKKLTRINAFCEHQVCAVTNVLLLKTAC